VRYLLILTPKRAYFNYRKLNTKIQIVSVFTFSSKSKSYRVIMENVSKIQLRPSGISESQIKLFRTEVSTIQNAPVLARVPLSITY